MKNDWIREIQGVGVKAAAQALGLQARRNQSLTPCPACGATTRSSSDRRGPVGVRNDDVGWRCWQCNITGDVPDLSSWVVHGKPMKELSKIEMTTLRATMSDKGMCSSESGFNKKVQPLVRPKPKPVQTQEPIDRSPKEFRWRENIVQECEDRMWSDVGASTLSYLMSRGFSEEALREWHIGCLEVKRRNGSEFYVAIPVFDKNGDAVNMRFRSVPGICGDCAGSGCRRCKQTGKTKKIYLRCPGRPSTLFAVKNLEADTDVGVIICEGELDVIAMWQFGFQKNVVSGTAGAGHWTEEWLDFLGDLDRQYSNAANMVIKREVKVLQSEMLKEAMNPKNYTFFTPGDDTIH